MTPELLKDLLLVAKGISDRISLEGKLFDELLEDNYGLSKGLCQALDNLVDTMDKHFGGAEWVSWYVFENDFGNNALEASTGNHPVVPIDSPEKLYGLIIGVY